MLYLTEEEKNIATRFLLLNTAIEILQKRDNPKLEVAIRKGIEERKELKKKMLEQRIKVIHNDSVDFFVYFTFYAGIKEVPHTYFKPALTKQVQKVIDELTGISKKHIQGEVN